MTKQCRRAGRAGMKCALILGGLSLLFSAPAHAIFGFGVHAGKDFVSIGNNDGFGDSDFQNAARSLGYQGLDVSKWTNVTLIRDQIASPWLIGGHFYIDALPFFDIEASVDAALRKYTATYKVGNNVIDSREVYFGRLSAYATIRRDLIKFPPVVPIAALYLGGGLGYHLVAPVAGPKLVVDAIGTGSINSSPNFEDKVKREGSFGYHGLVGVRLKPPIIPLAFRLEGKYTVTGIDTFERPGGIFSAYVGTSLDF